MTKKPKSHTKPNGDKKKKALDKTEFQTCQEINVPDNNSLEPDCFTMGSLFDGIAGFPLASINNGITPIWASEIEAFPIEVTKLRFPEMHHVGDITQLNGAELPPVDVITGGSPCQDYAEEIVIPRLKLQPC